MFPILSQTMKRRRWSCKCAIDHDAIHGEKLGSYVDDRGLGIGTLPAALITHGVDTTVVEIDPVVYEYALKYFQLPSNHTPVVEDAVSYTENLANSNTTSSRFDYIVHDVFTGGAEPIELFTLEFLENLNKLLTAEGVIAIVRKAFPMGLDRNHTDEPPRTTQATCPSHPLKSSYKLSEPFSQRVASSASTPATRLPFRKKATISPTWLSSAPNVPTDN
jgi:spermidine synthase